MAAKRKAAARKGAAKKRVTKKKAAKAVRKSPAKRGVASKSKKTAPKSSKKRVVKTAARKSRKPAAKSAPKSAPRGAAKKTAAPARSATTSKSASKSRKSYELKTKATAVSVEDFVAAVENPVRRDQARIAIEMMRRVTGEEPKMWGPSIVGFGKYAYTYDSGHSGEMCITGFSPRKAQFVFYLIGHPPESDPLWSRLGKCTKAKSCIYVNKFEDIDLGVMEQLVARSVEAIRARYPTAAQDAVTRAA